MDIDIDDFREHFELLSDAALLHTRRDDLVDAAKTVYDAEVARRGLDNPSWPAEDASSQPGDETEEDPEGLAPEALVSVQDFTVLEEARLARGLLQGAGIPCGLANDKQSLGILHLMVPEGQVDAALEVLGGEISEEELAAQAEAAALEDDIEEDDLQNEPNRPD